MKEFSTRIETIIKRDNGLRVKIIMEIRENYHGYGSRYHWCIATCEKGRRTWLPVYDDNDFKFRALPFGGQEREDYIYKKQLEVVAHMELADVAMKLWEQMKP